MKKNLIGIDEAGRGPLAGPVSVAAFVTFQPISIKYWQIKVGAPLRDSKKLSKLQREAWFSYLYELKKQGKVDFAVSLVGAAIIDRKGIVHAISQALKQSLEKLDLNPQKTKVLLDGNLYAPDEYNDQTTIVRGDEQIPIIALASIIAKVHRDNFMQKMAKRYPAYGFETHMGYGVKSHYKALRQKGMSPLHRITFLKNL